MESGQASAVRGDRRRRIDTLPAPAGEPHATTSHAARTGCTTMPRIVLASTSPYRQQLLARLHLPFDCISPQVDEVAIAGESPRVTARRLAQAKAEAVAAAHPDALVIGADQVADLDGKPLNKPGSHTAALSQLITLQGRTAVFHSGLALAAEGGRRVTVDSVPTTVRFRSLSRAQLDAYLHIDRPYDCAGSAKIESLGIALVEWVRSDDPTALIGLPLIRLVGLLSQAGVTVGTAGAAAHAS